jgi:hypothetical protein
MCEDYSKHVQPKAKPVALKPLTDHSHNHHDDHNKTHENQKTEKVNTDLVQKIGKVLKQNVMHRGDSNDSSRLSRSISSKKKHLSMEMTDADTIETLSKIYNSKNAYVPIDQKSAPVREIYREMLQTMHIAPVASKVKLENQRITRAHIKAYLEKRYDARQVEIILQTIKFPATSTYEEHWKHLDRFIGGDIKQKKKLGFLLHDINGDGRICPNDVFELSSKVNQTSNLLSNDIY